MLSTEHGGLPAVESPKGVSPLGSHGTVLESLPSHGSSCLITNVFLHDGYTNFQTLNPQEFIRRFSLHILPKGFPRIRHYGILSSKRKQKTLPFIHEQLNGHYQKAGEKDWKQISTDLGYNPDCCPVCKKQSMITILCFDRRGPPDRTFIKSLMQKETTYIPAS